MNAYRLRVWDLLEQQLLALPQVERVLDYGSGDGWFASRFKDTGHVGELVAIDVKRRQHVFVEPMLYDGNRLPFANRCFDLVYSVDVLHHCHDPVAQLLELDRVASRYILLKDHTFSSAGGRWALAVLDELGNRRFGIPSPHNYQHGFEWEEHLLARGWKRRSLVHPAQCHDGLMGKLTNALQYVACYERA